MRVVGKGRKERCTPLKRWAGIASTRWTTTAMDLLQHGVEQAVIALWLGHESIETTQIYLDANLELKQRVLDTVTPLNGKPGRYRPCDKLLAFLTSL